MVQFIKDNLTMVLTTLAVLSHVVFVVSLFLCIFEEKFRFWLYRFVDKNVLVLVFWASLVAMLSSLEYSSVIGFPPCELCWVQRIFMYPQVVLALLAIWKKDKNIVKYLFVLSILGGVVALYHSFAQWGIGTSLLECVAAGGDCGKLYVFEYGYVTIPFMSFTIFAYLIGISIAYFKSQNPSQK